jgi:hypothetical protein
MSDDNRIRNSLVKNAATTAIAAISSNLNQQRVFLWLFIWTAQPLTEVTMILNSNKSKYLEDFDDTYY